MSRDYILRAAYARLVRRHGGGITVDYPAFVRSMSCVSTAGIIREVKES